MIRMQDLGEDFEGFHQSRTGAVEVLIAVGDEYPSRPESLELGPTGLGDFVVTAVTIGNPHCVIFYDGVNQAQLVALAKKHGLPGLAERFNVKGSVSSSVDRRCRGARLRPAVAAKAALAESAAVAL